MSIEYNFLVYNFQKRNTPIYKTTPEEVILKSSTTEKIEIERWIQNIKKNAT
ncbi:hypothetical protein [Methanolapillus africanus]|uniref:hypothetical protein n=1 Tax=Methanolapillus africanus TaxID=3028297 RepID=UPI0030B8AEC4